MKLKFTIQYNTAWGESLHVVVSYHSQDGSCRQQNLTMQTDDGQQWVLETAALISRHHPLSYIEYHYQVENGEGEVLRREWMLVPRRYYFDASKDYVFPDQWRDRPLAYHLYSDAYHTSMHSKHGEEVEAARLPLFRRTVQFRVSAPQLQAGQAVAVCGSHPSIGSWNTSRYLQMQYVGNGEWMLTVDAMGWLMPIEYKYVVIDIANHALVAWEEGDNRVISDELTDGEVLVLYGDALRLCEQPWRLAGVSIPVFSLRSEHSYGVGDFGDLKRLVDWAVLTGMKVIQLLPVNDTTTNHHWADSCPYNVVSFFALHPHYIDLEAAGTLRSKQKMTQYLRRRQELNALPVSDYEAVDRVKSEYLRELFAEQGKKVSESKECKAFVEDNEDWLTPYAEYRQEPLDYVRFV
jgi:4-alpha-glucanotransferase